MPADDNNITTTSSSTTTTTIPIIAAADASVPERHDAVGWIGPQDGTILAKLEAPDGASFFVTKRQVVIGRESTHSDTDVPVADTNYVSRGHLVLNCRDDGVWTIICNGKNGVFVNNQLVKKATEPCPIPKICHLRFPSTSVRVGFASLAGPAPATSANHNRIQDVAKNANDSGFVSPSDLVCSVSAAVISPPSLLFVRKEEPVVMVSASTTKPGDLSDGDDTCGGGESVCATGKPPYSYAQLIVQAIDSTSDKQMTLSGIYAYITKCYPWYRTSDKGWQNSIRHNLSLNRYFLKVPRSQEEPGKGSFWRLDPSSQAKLLQFAFRKRRQRGSSGSNGCLGAKGVRSAPVSPSLDGGSKSDGELHDVFPGDINDTKPGCALTPPLCQSAPILIVPNDPKPSSSMVSPNTDHHHSAYSPSSNTNAPPLLNDVVSVKALANTINKESSKQPVFRFSPIDTEVSSSGNCSRFIQSAPCSPKGFKEGYPKREHHHSGGPFRVRTSVKDGRHRLQLCHSPPEYVPVSHPDVSALQMLSNQQNRKLSKTLLQHYRGGSQSLSTTPVREILSGGARLLQEDRIAKALLDASPEPKVLKRRLQQQQAPATIDQQHHSDGNNGFTQPSASTIAALSSSNLHAGIQTQQQQQQQLFHQAYSNQLAAAGYLNPTTTTWLQNAVASLYQGATPGAAASLFNIGGNHRGGVALVGVHHPTLLSVDSARLLAAAIGGVGGDSDNSSASMPKVARTE